ncbi:hypothetical protein BJ741DRAFT_605828 [Chytriomyces cf. hyalinus JEL632]|nr:hypothetical protein BJ741DRAFT_605828 [Chytriomyces cf. hyalinus JEL632]
MQRHTTHLEAPPNTRPTTQDYTQTSLTVQDHNSMCDNTAIMNVDMDLNNNSVHAIEASSTTIITNSSTAFATLNTDASPTRSQHIPQGRSNIAAGVGLRQLLEATIAIRYTPYGPKPKVNIPENERSSPVGADAMDVVVAGPSDNSAELSGSNPAETQNNHNKTKKMAKESSRVMRRKRGELPRVETRMVTRSRSSASLNAVSASSSSNRNSSSPMPELGQPADETPSPTSPTLVPTSAVANADVEMTNGTQIQIQKKRTLRKPNGRAQKGMLSSVNLATSVPTCAVPNVHGQGQEQDAPGALPTHAAAAETSMPQTPSSSSAYLLNSLAEAALALAKQSAEKKIALRLSSNATTTETSVQQQDRPHIEFPNVHGQGQEQDAPGAPPTHAAAAENSMPQTPSASSAYLLNNLAEAALELAKKSAEKLALRLSSNATTSETFVQQQDRPHIEWLVSSPVPLKAQKNQDINARTSMTEPTMFRTGSLEDLADIAISAADSPHMGQLNPTPMDHDSPSSVPETADRRNIASSSSGSAAQKQIQEPRPMSLLDNPNLNPDGSEKIPTVVKFYDPLRMYSKKQLAEDKTKNVTQTSSSSNTLRIQGTVAINQKEVIQDTTQAIQSSSCATAPCIQGPQPTSLLNMNANVPVQDSQPMSLLHMTAKVLVRRPQPTSLLNMNANVPFQESQPMSLLDLNAYAQHTAHMDINEDVLLQESEPTGPVDINDDVVMQDSQPTAQHMDINQDDLDTDMELNEENTQAVHILSNATIPFIQEPRPMSLLDINPDLTRKIHAADPYFDRLLAHSQKAQQAKLNKSQGAVQTECTLNPEIQQMNLQLEINDIPAFQQMNLPPEMNVNTAVEQVNLHPEGNVNTAVEKVGLQPEINVNTAVERVGLQSVVHVNTAVEQVGLQPVVNFNTAVEQVGLRPAVNVNTAVEQVGLQSVVNVNRAVEQVGLQPVVNENPAVEQVGLQSEVNDNPALEQVNLLTEVRKIPRCLITNPPCWVTTGPRTKALRQPSAPQKNKLHSKNQSKSTSEQHVSPVITTPTVVPVAFKQPIIPPAPTSPTKRKGLPHRSPSHAILLQHPTREARADVGIVQMNVFEEYGTHPIELMSSRANDELAAQRLREREARMIAHAASKKRKGRAKKTTKVSKAAPKKKAAFEKAATKSSLLSKDMAHDSAISLDNTSGVRRGRSAGVPNAASLKRGRDVAGEEGAQVVGSGDGDGSGGAGSSKGEGAVVSSSVGGVGRQGEESKRRKTAGGRYVATGACQKLFPSSWSTTGAASATGMAAQATAATSAVAAPSPSVAGTSSGGPVGRSGSHSSKSEGPGGDVVVRPPGTTDNDKLRALPFELISKELLADYTSCKQRGDPVTWKKTPVTFANCAGIDLLADDEVEACNTLRVPPVDYLHVKHILLSARDKFETFTKRQAQKWYGIDVNKTGKIFDWFVSKKWLLLPPKGKDAPQAMVADKAKPARRRR